MALERVSPRPVFSLVPVKVPLKLILTFTILLAECTLGFSRVLALMNPLKGRMVLPIVTRPGTILAAKFSLVRAPFDTICIVSPVRGRLTVPEIKGIA